MCARKRPRLSVGKWAAAMLLAVAATLSAPALAHDYKLGDLTITHPWARATIGMGKTGAAYLVVSNGGTAPDRLIATRTDAARKAGLHTNLVENGVMKMRPVEAIEVAPGEPAVLRPGGPHIMLMGLKAPLQEGTTFAMTLTFEKAGTIQIQVDVQGGAALRPRTHAPGS